jgi:hypothetical protein
MCSCSCPLTGLAICSTHLGLSYGAKQARKCLPPSFPSLRDRKHKRQTVNTLLHCFTELRHSRKAYVHVVVNALVCLCYQKGYVNVFAIAAMQADLLVCSVRVVFTEQKLCFRAISMHAMAKVAQHFLNLGYR